MTYRPLYNEPFTLPPKVSPQLPTRGTFTLTFSDPKFLIQTPLKHHIRYKLWGEDQHRNSNYSTPTTFEIKCNNKNFASYLRDMKFLKVEIIDARNSAVIAGAVVNLMLYINPEPLVNQTDCPFIPMRECFELIKNNITKNKVGEIQVELGCGFMINPRGEELMINHHKDREKLDSAFQLMSDQKVEIPFGMRSVSFKKDMELINGNSPSGHLDNTTNINQINHIHSISSINNEIPYPKPNRAKGKVAINQYPFDIQSTSINPPSINVEAERAKLRLDALQLLSTPPTEAQPRDLKIVISKATLNAPQSTLTLEYPAKIGYNKVKISSLQVLPVSSSKNEIRYNRVFLLPNFRQFTNHCLKFTFRSKKQTLGIAECPINDLTLRQPQEIKLSITSKGKEIGKVFVQIPFENTQQPLKQQDQNPLTNAALSSPAKTPTPQNLSTELMIIISILKAQVINQSSYDVLFFKSSFKFQKESYETNMSKTKRWNFNLTTSINPTLVQSPFLMFQLWGSGAQTNLLGIGKYRTKQLMQILASGVTTANLQPVLLYDSNLPLQHIGNKQNIGYLSLKIKVGTPRQISKSLQAMTQPRPNSDIHKMQSEEYPSHSSSTPQLVSDRDAISSKPQQSKSKHSPQVPLSARPSEGNDQPSQHQILEIHNLMQTITGFFSNISDSKEKIELILKQMNLSGDMRLQQFDKVISNVIDNHEQYWDVICFFYGQGDYMNTLQFLKSFSSFVNFKEILIEQLTALLQELNGELSKHHVSLDVVENKLSQYSQFGFVSNQNVREVFRGYKIDGFLIDRILETYASTQQNQLQVSEFIHHLKCTKFSKSIESLNYNVTNLQHLIQNSVIDVIAMEAESVNIITETFSGKNMDSKGICKLLETLQVDVSIWESLLLIESIKIFFKQDLDLVEGIISSKVMINWLKSIININQIPRAESVGMRTEPDVVVLRTVRTETQSEDIGNIADLLKEKDKFQYDDSSLPKKRMDNNPSEYPSKLLEQSKQQHNYIPDPMRLSYQQDPRSSRHIQHSSPSIPNPISQNVSEIHTPNLKHLKIKVLEIKLDTDFNYLTLQLQLGKSYEILIKKHQGILKYYSPSTFYEQIDINNLSQYKQYIQGLNIVCRTLMNSSVEDISKGFISFEDVFKPQNTTRKICIIYNNQMKIVGRISFQISYLDKEQQSQTISKEVLYLRVLKIDSNIPTQHIKFSLNQSVRIQDIEMKKEYLIELDYKMFKSVGEFTITTLTETLTSEFSIENLFKTKVAKIDLPLLKQNSEYYGLMQVELVIKEEEELTAVNVTQTNSFTGIIYLDSLISRTDKNRNLNVCFSAGNGFSNSSPIFQQLPLEQPLSTIPINQIHYLHSIKPEQDIEVSIQDANSKLELGTSRFRINHPINKQLSYLSTLSVTVLNKFNMPMILNVRVIVFESRQSTKLGNIVERLRKDRVERVLSNAKTINTVSVRNALRLQGITLSEIQYFIHTLGEESVWGKREEQLIKIFEKDAKPTKQSREDSIQLLKEFDFYDHDRTGRVEKEQLQRVLEGYQIQENDQQNYLLDLNNRTQLVSYLPYLAHIVIENQINQIPTPIPRDKEPKVEQQQSTYNIQTGASGKSDDFKRICGEINKLHEILTKAKHS